MTIAVFDTLKLARRPEAAGMPPPQAEGFAEALSDVMTTELATKSDLREMRSWTTAEFAGVRKEIADLRGWAAAEFAGVRKEIADLRGWATAEFADVRREMRTGFAEMRADLANTKTEMIRWMVGLFVAQASVTIGVLLRLAG